MRNQHISRFGKSRSRVSIDVPNIQISGCIFKLVGPLYSIGGAAVKKKKMREVLENYERLPKLKECFWEREVMRNYVSNGQI